ncbi:ImmA/IrrE family metallo-endopeptidase [Leucobacter sp. HY1908]
MHTLLAEATRLGVTVKYAPLQPPLRGAYIPAHDLIIIDQLLTLPQRRETLAHELGHAHHGHNCSSPRNEAQAWRRAAQLAVNVDDYARAERLNPHPAAIALELDLTTTLIIEWQKHFGHRYERKAA